MIYYVNGTLSSIKDDFIIIDINGMGYQVFCPETTIQELPDIGITVQLYTYHYIREDQQLLFGFLSEEARQFFTTLTTVSGIGPKLGVKILSSLSINALVQAIISSNLATLTSISGVGKKMAERMIIELKDKLTTLYGHSTIENPSTPAQAVSNKDLMLACKTLGYSQDEIKKGLEKANTAIKSNNSVEENLKILLKQL